MPARCLFYTIILFFRRWTNPSRQRHPWYSLCGNTTLFHHTQQGALDQLQSWIQGKTNASRTNSNFSNTSSSSSKSMVLLFTTGVVYVNYLVQKNLTFILHEELFSAAKIKYMMREQCSLIAMTSLKLMACKECCDGVQQSDLMALNVPYTGCANTWCQILTSACTNVNGMH